MTTEGRTKTATSNGLVRRRRPEPARRAAIRPRRPVGAGVAPTVIVLPSTSLRLGDRLARCHRLFVGSLELVGESLRRLLAGKDVLEPVAHRVVEPGGR